VDDGLALCKGEQVQILSQELPQWLGVLEDLAPMEGRRLCPGKLLPLLLDLRPLGPERPSPTLSCLQAADLGVIRVE